MVERNPVDVELRAKILKGSCEPFQHFHPASRRESQGYEIQSTNDPERAVTGELLEVDFK